MQNVSVQDIDIITHIRNVCTYIYPMRLDSRFYLGDAFDTPPGIFQAENVLHTQKLRNVSSITHACVRAYACVCTCAPWKSAREEARRESPSRLRSHLSSGRNAALCIPTAPFYFSTASNFLVAFHISALIKEKVYVDTVRRVKQVNPWEILKEESEKAMFWFWWCNHYAVKFTRSFK